MTISCSILVTVLVTVVAKKWRFATAQLYIHIIPDPGLDVAHPLGIPVNTGTVLMLAFAAAAASEGCFPHKPGL